MRARLVRPEFWHDEKMADLPLPTRLTYIGLWCIADDAGYLAWSPREIGADLYPHMTVGRRDRQITTDLERLVAAGRVVVLDCERHALIPTLERHRIAGGNRSEKVKHAHLKESTDTSVQRSTQRTDKSRSESVSPSLSESVSPSPRGRSPRRNGLSTAENDDYQAEVQAAIQKRLGVPA